MIEIWGNKARMSMKKKDRSEELTDWDASRGLPGHSFLPGDSARSAK
jgi:hypothetical protein